MSLSDDQVRRIARLARIELAPQEVQPVAARLNRVLGLIEQMRAVDTRGIEPMAHPLDLLLQGQRLREDRAEGAQPREAFQAAAPATQDGLYLVPKVIE
ncbi:MAG TPA: Asp-tRNA(Asn)/Glu-tRNA(Gln) amidotransferase subunit GatC [Burkholderiales bacterium]|jgi:aspartyl-tRNA(Asn)/glutamyl-tRNA(Gln) amidotransferase subunit C